MEVDSVKVGDNLKGTEVGTHTILKYPKGSINRSLCSISCFYFTLACSNCNVIFCIFYAERKGHASLLERSVNKSKCILNLWHRLILLGVIENIVYNYIWLCHKLYQYSNWSILKETDIERARGKSHFNSDIKNLTCLVDSQISSLFCVEFN